MFRWPTWDCPGEDAIRAEVEERVAWLQRSRPQDWQHEVRKRAERWEDLAARATEDRPDYGELQTRAKYYRRALL